MENHQNEKSLLNVAQTQSHSLQNYDDKARSRNKKYLAETAELVRRTLSLSNQPSLTEQELGQRAMDWQDALEGIVPVNKLQDAFKAALQTHTGSFPVNAFEVIEAWRGMRSQPVDEWAFQKRLLEQGNDI